MQLKEKGTFEEMKHNQTLKEESKSYQKEVRKWTDGWMKLSVLKTIGLPSQYNKGAFLPHEYTACQHSDK